MQLFAVSYHQQQQTLHVPVDSSHNVSFSSFIQRFGFYQFLILKRECKLYKSHKEYFRALLFRAVPRWTCDLQVNLITVKVMRGAGKCSQLLSTLIIMTKHNDRFKLFCSPQFPFHKIR